MKRLGKLWGVVGMLVVMGGVVGVVWSQLGPAGEAGVPATQVTEVAAGTTSGPAVKVVPPVGLDSVIVQRVGDRVNLLNAEVKVPGTGEMKHVDVSMKLGVDKEGKVVVESVETRATTLVGVGSLVAGVYVADNKVTYELKGPALDVDMRATWSIAGRYFNGTVVAGPAVGNPQLAGIKGVEGLPEAGAYGLANHNGAFAGFQNTNRTLVNLRQVGDTLVITAYGVANGKVEQTGNVVLKRQ